MQIHSPGGSALVRLTCAAAFCIPVHAQAAINKCVGADGNVAFSDQPCSSSHYAMQLRVPEQRNAPATKPPTKVEMASEGAARPNSELHRYDMQCDHDRRLLAEAQGRVNDPIGNENLQLRKSRADQRCNPQMRADAFDRDLEGQAISCKVGREELAVLKKMPPFPPGHASQAPGIARRQAWLEANCPAASS
jgi:hypothetical protein